MNNYFLSIKNMEEFPPDCLKEIFKWIWWMAPQLSLSCRTFREVISGKERTAKVAAMHPIIPIITKFAIKNKNDKVIEPRIAVDLNSPHFKWLILIMKKCLELEYWLSITPTFSIDLISPEIIISKSIKNTFDMEDGLNNFAKECGGEDILFDNEFPVNNTYLCPCITFTAIFIPILLECDIIVQKIISHNELKYFGEIKQLLFPNKIGVKVLRILKKINWDYIDLFRFVYLCKYYNHGGDIEEWMPTIRKFISKEGGSIFKKEIPSGEIYIDKFSNKSEEYFISESLYKKLELKSLLGI